MFPKISFLNILLFAFSQTTSAQSLIYQPESTSSRPTLQFTSPDYAFSRSIFDADGDEWCDQWVSLFPELDCTQGRLHDTDGDTISDYDEMILMRDPFQPEPVPTFADKENRRIESEQEMARKLSERQQELVKAAREKEQLLGKEFPYLKDPDVRRPTREDKNQQGKALKAIFTDLIQKREQAGKISLRQSDSSFDRIANAEMIGADHLWDGTVSPFFNVTGDIETAIGIWDLGWVRPAELPGQIIPGESQSDMIAEGGLSISAHAERVAKTMALDVMSDERGIASGLQMKTFHLKNDYSEMLDEALDELEENEHGEDELVKGMQFSSHAYSPFAGWRYTGATWEWLGPRDIVGKDPEFGAYTLDSKMIDFVLYSRPQYLSIHSASNESSDRGPVAFGGSMPSELSYTARWQEDVNGNCIIEFSEIFFETRTEFHPSDSGEPLAGAISPDAYYSAQGDFSYEDHFDPIGIGSGTIKSTVSAKNNLSVGVVDVEDCEVNTSSEILLELISSRGPTDDGRIKPDLTAPSRGFGAGPTTSGATAVVTGTLGLLQQIVEEMGGPRYLSSTWKALLLNTTYDGTHLPPYLGSEAAAAQLVGPDYFFGWGMLNAEAAADLLVKDLRAGDQNAHLCEFCLFDGSEIDIPITHDGTSPQIKVMLCWTDPPYQTKSETMTTQETLDASVVDPEVDPDGPGNLDNDVATDRLINDLDLVVIAPDGTTEHMPWILDPANLLTPATKGINTRDNVEQVVIDTPLPGTYLIKVKHKGTLHTAELVGNPDPVDAQTETSLVPNQLQDFSLAISGNQGPSPRRPKLFNIRFTNNNLDLDFSMIGFPGVRYQLQESLDLITWDDLEVPFETPTRDVTSLSEATDIRVLAPLVTGKRFYRVREIGPATP